MLSRLTRTIARAFCTGQVQRTAGTAVTDTAKENTTPVHLRPYDKSKYETPLEKIKLNSGRIDVI